MSRLIDLSHALEPGMPAYPGLPVPHFGTHFTHEESAARATYAPGTTFQIATYAIGGNTGTYVDAPFHRHPTLPDLAGLPLDTLADLPGVVVTAGPEGAIGPQAFGGLDLRDKAVLVHTGAPGRFCPPPPAGRWSRPGRRWWALIVRTLTTWATRRGPRTRSCSPPVSRLWSTCAGWTSCLRTAFAFSPCHPRSGAGLRSRCARSLLLHDQINLHNRLNKI